MTDAARGPQAAAELWGVHKRYGQVDALHGVDLELRPGELVALLGPNGAGKTTAVSIVLGQRRPDAGSAWLFGREATIPAARRPVGATPQEIGFPDNLKVGEVIELVRAHYPQPAPTEEVLARFGLVEVAGRRTGGLSGGQKRRLAVPGRRCWVSPPRLETGLVWWPTPWASLRWRRGATDETRAPATADGRAVRSCCARLGGVSVRSRPPSERVGGRGHQGHRKETRGV
jgi:ABC-type molybdate transport system ATPase subunit